MRALLSVATRDGITALARDLQSLGVEVFATDGTRDHLAQDGIEVAPVSDLTGIPALLGGQVKTFHPAVYAGILARRDKAEQLAELAEQGIGTIDIVVVNVKPFGAEIGRSLVGIEQAIEMIDVGGAALLGAAARNAAGVAAVASPEHYPRLVAELKERGLVSPEFRALLAAEAFGTVAAYHAEIAAYLNQLSGTIFPKRLAMVLEKVAD
ncbi:MAG: bifunctional phosphoribosylaminoimidazolecarboxamide formyltransferase/IMP cyclohydrolase, partial [Chloroflexota bacterium]